jgi:hypothetical protein
MGQWAKGKGQWAVAAGTRERDEERRGETRRDEERRGETRESPPMGHWGSRAGRAWAVRLSVGSPIPGPDQTLPINQQPAHRRPWGVALQPHPRGREQWHCERGRVVGSEWPWNGDGGGGQPAAPLGLLTQARTCISPLYSQVQQSKRAREQDIGQ